MLRFIAILFFLSLCEPAFGVADSDVIHYTVSLPAPQTQMVDISVEIGNIKSDHIDFCLPVWRPGRYYILNPAATVREVRAISDHNTPLQVKKIDKSTWRVASNGGHRLKLAYRIYANSLGDRTRHVDDTHAFLDGAAVFMYVPQLRANPVEVRIDAPKEWKIATGLDFKAEDVNTVAASNYDQLVDCPLEIGVHDVIEFQALNKPHQIIIWGKADYNAEQLKKDFATIVETEATLFGGAPYSRYVFITHVGAGAGGGTEHINSTVIQTSRASLEDPDAYKRFLGLVAHEMFHTWNVKSFRPAEIHPYDYQHENYSKLLWVAEGTTSYYSQIMLVRAGFKTPDDLLDDFSNAIDSMQKRPGELVQSVEQSSFDSWIQFEKPTADSVNSVVNFYGKGSLVSLLLDLTIRTRTGNAHTLDDVMRQLYERFPLSGPGYRSEDLQGLVEELCASDFDEFFENFVRGAKALDFQSAFSAVGLELQFKKSKQDAADSESIAYLGLNLNDQGGHAIVSSVLSDGPAYVAGIIVGDEILALDSRKITAGEIDKRLKNLKPHQIVQLTYFRREELRTVSITLGEKPNGSWKLYRMKDANVEQKSGYESWLGQKWPD